MLKKKLYAQRSKNGRTHAQCARGERLIYSGKIGTRALSLWPFSLVIPFLMRPLHTAQSTVLYIHTQFAGRLIEMSKTG